MEDSECFCPGAPTLFCVNANIFITTRMWALTQPPMTLCRLPELSLCVCACMCVGVHRALLTHADCLLFLEGEQRPCLTWKRWWRSTRSEYWGFLPPGLSPPHTPLATVPGVPRAEVAGPIFRTCGEMSPFPPTTTPFPRYSKAEVPCRGQWVQPSEGTGHQQNGVSGTEPEHLFRGPRVH